MGGANCPVRCFLLGDFQGNVRDNVRGERPDPHAGLQVSTCGGYDLSHRG